MNRMLDAAERAQLQLFAMNEALDLKIGELSEANVGLGESNRLKSEFLANVSHELRTPLNSIIGFADLLEEIARSEPAPDPKRLRYIGNIQRSGRSLLDMINSLLDMAKIEAGRMEVTVAPASAADVVEGLQAIMRPLAVQKRIDLQARVADGLPKVETDAGKLQQILYNYLSNAIKFSPEDGAVIVSVARAERNGGEAVRISVTDHGPGIPEDMQETIFEKFRQVDASHTRRAGGTGLGLAICRELADLMGCSVGLVSASGKGSTFWVEVPVVHRPRELKPLMADAAVTRP
jgi:signal transduction histidine kinase